VNQEEVVSQIRALKKNRKKYQVKRKGKKRETGRSEAFSLLKW